jgi:hypothetical protein
VSWNGAEIGRQEDSMKKVLSRITGMLALAFLAAHAVEAQEPVLANIPFAFTAGKMALPAGEYRVQESAQGSFMLLIQRTDRSAATFVMSNAVEVNRPQAHSKLVFHRIGNRCHSRGRELAPSSKEKQQGLLARNEAPDQVTIVARLIPSNH